MGARTVVLGYARTPFGRFLGALKDIAAVDLGALVLKEALRRAKVEPGSVDYVFLGMVLQAGAGQIPSRQATLKAGLPVAVPSDTVNKVCASGMRAVNLGDLAIRAGEASIVVAGGMENMSAAPYLLNRSRSGLRIGDAPLVDGMIKDGLWCPFNQVHMGVYGSMVPAQQGISREETDLWALRSHSLAIEAADSGWLTEEIIPVSVAIDKAEPFLLECDELPRRGLTYKQLAALPPVFEPQGLVSAGNAPAISDGAAALVLAAEDRARDWGLEPLAKIIAQGNVSLEPPYIAAVPYFAAEAALDKAGLEAKQIDLIEVNEAFAAVALTSLKLGGWPEEKVNINGGAVALGHPIGASGARILMSLIAGLRRRGGGYGLATICSGAAQGEAVVVEVR